MVVPAPAQCRLSTKIHLHVTSRVCAAAHDDILHRETRGKFLLISHITIRLVDLKKQFSLSLRLLKNTLFYQTIKNVGIGVYDVTRSLGENRFC